METVGAELAGEDAVCGLVIPALVDDKALTDAAFVATADKDIVALELGLADEKGTDGSGDTERAVLQDGEGVIVCVAHPLAVVEVLRVRHRVIALTLGDTELLDNPEVDVESDVVREASGEGDGETLSDTVRARLAETLGDGLAEGVGMTKTMGAVDDTLVGVLSAQRT